MPIIPNIPRKTHARLRNVPDDFIAWPYVDTLYDYTQILGEAPIFSFPDGPPPPGSVAIIGAGAAGMVAAYELLKSGIVPVVYEATDRIGGRNWSKYFTNHGAPTNVIAEMGAMRIPVSNKVFWHYADLFRMETTDFPDPGSVPTTLYYENTPYPWLPGQNPPGPFQKISTDFHKFVNPMMEEIWKPWQKKDWKGVQAVWQRYIKRYANKTFFEALAEGIPQWTAEDLNAFGALGMGSGGFGPLYEINFLEMLRILVNQWEVEQKLIKGGINELTDRFYHCPVRMPDGRRESLASLGAVRFDTLVTRLEQGPGKNLKVTSFDRKTQKRTAHQASAVIVATTTRAMEILIGLTLSDKNMVAQKVKNAVRNLHLMDSSKMFIRTATKFWLDSNGKPLPGMPQNIQTDELPRGVYCLDYPQTENGVVLISYTWGDDSSKLLGLDVPTRFQTFKHILNVIHPQFARNLVPVNDEILNIDWEAEPYHYGAFKLQYPGQEPDIHAAYYQFLSVMDPGRDTGLYLAGDSVSWSGGWTEGALQTGLNAACAAAKRLGASLPVDSPLSQNPNLYHYGS